MALTFYGCAAALAVFFTSSSSWAYVGFDEVRSAFVRSEGVLLDRSGKVLQEMRVDSRARKIEWTALTAISPALKEAVIFSEDHRFYDHGGVDWRALVKAAGQNLLGKSKRGASTISMQLAALVDEKLPRSRGRRGWAAKAKQISSALDLERSWNKDQILEAYLNLISFRGELQGVASASRGLFAKDPHGLSEDEALVLAALIRAPEANPARVAERACELGTRLASAGHREPRDCASLKTLVTRTQLKPGPIGPRIAWAPHLAEALLGSDARTVKTTLDVKLQAFATESLRRHVLDNRERNVNDGAVLVLDNATGEVLAYVGGVGELSSARYVDGIRAPRQAGSTLKPFLYGLAIEQRYLTAATQIDDAPTDIPLPQGVYRPSNYDRTFHGAVSVREALASSLNVPAVRALSLVGVPALVAKLERFGFKNLREADHYGPSLALGSADITLWDLTGAYRAIATGGLWSEPRFVKSQVKSRRALSHEAAFIVSDMLADRESRNLTFGLDNALAQRFWSAAKTGTSKDMRDNWCVGYSRRYTVGVWVGNFSGKPMWNVSGITGAAPTWAEVMSYLHSRQPSRSPKAPKGVVRVQGEWFIAGTERAAGASLASTIAKPRPKITYPPSGMIIAHDPDIPGDLERVFFESSVKDPGLSFWLNGKRLSQADGSYAWKPAPVGQYQLTLVDARGEILDAVDFSVRGSADTTALPPSSEE